MPDADVARTDEDRIDEGRTEALVERLFEATIGALELMSVHLGWRLGLYELLASSPPMSAEDLAGKAGIHVRYATEWLEQQAIAGLLEVEEPAGAAGGRRYSLPAEHATVLAAPESPSYVAPFAPMLAGIAGALPDVVEAYRTGGGVPYARYGSDFRSGQGAINRPAFVHELGAWFAASPAIHERLSANPPARVADVGCGQGWSSLAIAAAYPKVRVDGFDLDEASVREAQDAHGAPADRVSFAVRDATTLAEAGPYDLVCIFEALHDMARPEEALAGARAALAPGGSVLVADERVAPEFGAVGDQVERMMYGWSVLHCLPASMADQPSAALGTVLREGTVRELAARAGFPTVEVLPIENDFFRFYRLVP